MYVYVGTGSLPLPRLRRVLPAVFPAGGPVTCLVGAPSLTRPERAGAAEFRPYVPAGDILPAADWTICHGGQNTIAQSLLHHVPLLIFPGPIFERRYNAAKTQAAGAGQLCELSDFTPGRLRALLGQRDRYTAGAAALGQALRASSGPSGAIDVLEQHAASAPATPEPPQATGNHALAAAGPPRTPRPPVSAAPACCLFARPAAKDVRLWRHYRRPHLLGVKSQPQSVPDRR